MSGTKINFHNINLTKAGKIIDAVVIFILLIGAIFSTYLIIFAFILVLVYGKLFPKLKIIVEKKDIKHNENHKYYLFIAEFIESLLFILFSIIILFSNIVNIKPFFILWVVTLFLFLLTESIELFSKNNIRNDISQKRQIISNLAIVIFILVYVAALYYPIHEKAISTVEIPNKLVLYKETPKSKGLYSIGKNNNTSTKLITIMDKELIQEIVGHINNQNIERIRGLQFVNYKRLSSKQKYFYMIPDYQGSISSSNYRIDSIVLLNGNLYLYDNKAVFEMFGIYSLNIDSQIKNKIYLYLKL